MYDRKYDNDTRRLKFFKNDGRRSTTTVADSSTTFLSVLETVHKVNY